MRSASNETPTSVDKLSLNEELVGRVIIPFEKIIIKNPDYKTWSQYNAFFSDYPRKKEILNNPLLRGVTDNIAVLTDDKLADNLLWLWQTDSLKCFIRLASCGFSNLKCEVSGYYDRVFIPFTKKMLQSLFSLRGWSKSQDFNNLVQYLRQNKLEEQADKSYVFCDWKYYMITYSSFRTGVYGQFELPDETQRMSFEATYIENERATKNKIRKPFYTRYISRGIPVIFHTRIMWKKQEYHLKEILREILSGITGVYHTNLQRQMTVLQCCLVKYSICNESKLYCHATVSNWIHAYREECQIMGRRIGKITLLRIIDYSVTNFV